MHVRTVCVEQQQLATRRVRAAAWAPERAVVVAASTRAGDVPPPEGAQTVYTPLLSNLHLHYYNVKLDSIAVAGQALDVDAVRRPRSRQGKAKPAHTGYTGIVLLVCVSPRSWGWAAPSFRVPRGVM